MTAKTVKAATNSQARSVSPWGKPAEWPWWLIAAIGLVFYLVYLVLTDAETRSSFWYMLGQKPEALLLGQLAFKGIVITLVIAICGYLVAMSFGLLLGLMRTSSNPILNNVASFYVEIIRGVPMLVLLLYVAFVIAPPITPFFASIANIFVNLGNLLLYNTGIISEPFKAVTTIANHWRAIIALGLGYFQMMRHIILPQAIRRVLPALGNDFISMVKDSSLASVLGVQDMTQLAKLVASGNFLYMQTLTLLAFVYLTIVVLLTRLLRAMERRLQSVYVR